jgi:hypothetical protein
LPRIKGDREWELEIQKSDSLSLILIFSHSRSPLIRGKHSPQKTMSWPPNKRERWGSVLWQPIDTDYEGVGGWQSAGQVDHEGLSTAR